MMPLRHWLAERRREAFELSLASGTYHAWRREQPDAFPPLVQAENADSFIAAARATPSSPRRTHASTHPAPAAGNLGAGQPHGQPAPLDSEGS